MSSLRRTRRFTAVLLLTAALATAAAAKADFFADLARGAELLGVVYRHLANSYVDEVDLQKLLEAGLSGMTSALDPYTAYERNREKADYDLLSTGEYSGVGLHVTRRDGRFIIWGLYDAVRTVLPLRVGDELLRIDSTDLRTDPPQDVRTLLRGEAGTPVMITVRRPGVPDTLSFTIMRRVIPVRSVSCAERLPGDLAYVRIDRFTRHTGAEVADTLRRYGSVAPLKGVLLDLRNNPGGLLEAAVDVVELFVPKGNLIVSTLGRQPAFTRRYFSTDEPLLPRVPLAVLVNQNSASASEIVAGALQDLDRALIVGQRSFGKGLVQSVVPLNDNATLKLTTSRYYIPSGRCIQRARPTPGSPALRPRGSDSIRHFSTLVLGRSMREDDGITPDVGVAADTATTLFRALSRSETPMLFASWWINTRRPLAPPVADERMKRSFLHWVDSTAEQAALPLREAYRNLMETARDNALDEQSMNRLRGMESAVDEALQRQIDAAWPLLRTQLDAEFMRQMRGADAGFRVALPDDPQVQRAAELLRDAEKYRTAFRAPDPVKKSP